MSTTDLAEEQVPVTSSLAKSDPERAEANQLMGMGVGLGAFGAVSALTLGAVCPLCVVVAPAMVGLGLYKRLRHKPGDAE